MIKELTLKYLGYPTNSVDTKIEAIIDQCIEEIQSICQPKFVYKQFTLTHDPLEIKELQLSLSYPELIDLFDSCHSCIIIGCTLGQEIDRYLKYLSKIDMTKMTIFDAVASSYIEEASDQYQETLSLGEHTFRFCPGYGSVPIELNKTLARILDMSKHIGLTIQDSNILLPQKSMIGMIGIGDTNYKKHCFSCIKKQDCIFRKRGQRCYKTT